VVYHNDGRGAKDYVLGADGDLQNEEVPLKTPGFYMFSISQTLKKHTSSVKFSRPYLFPNSSTTETLIQFLLCQPSQNNKDTMERKIEVGARYARLLKIGCISLD